MIEWLKSHTNVIFQPPVGHRAYSGINPYALGFAMYTDIRRICENADRRRPRWFPDSPARRLAADARLRDAQLQGRELHRPVPVAQADARLPPVRDPRRRAQERSSRSRRSTTTQGYRARARIAVAPVRPRPRASPNIQVWSVNLRGDRSLTLRHTQHNNRPLHDGAQEVLKHVARLWGFGVHLESVDQRGDVSHGRSRAGGAA